MPWRCRYDDCNIEGADDAPILLSLRGSYVLLRAQTTEFKADPAAGRPNFRHDFTMLRHESAESAEDLAEIQHDLDEIRNEDLTEWLRLVRVAIASGVSDSAPLAFCSKQHLLKYTADRLAGLRFDEPTTPVE